MPGRKHPMPLEIAPVAEICERLQIPFIFKASDKKANRTSLNSATGTETYSPRNDADVGRQLSIAVVTDIHTADEAALAARMPMSFRVRPSLRQTEHWLRSKNRHSEY